MNVFLWVEMLLKNILVWPLFAFLIIVIFQNQIRNFIKRITGISWKNLNLTADSQSDSSQTTSLRSLSQMEYKILNTLMINQKKNHGDRKDVVWGFSISPHSNDFPNFMISAMSLVKKNLVFFNPEAKTIHLSNDGFIYCEDNKIGDSLKEKYPF